jgi:hypothetical protein
LTPPANREGSEVEKARRYARLGVRYDVIFDPERWLGDRVLRGYVLHGLDYVELMDLSWIEELDLGLVTWPGLCEDMEGLWLRPCGPDKGLLPLPTEVAEVAETRAEVAQARAEAAEERAERLLARLRELGVEE